MKIGIFGLWHLGCVLAASWSKSYNVIGYDYDDDNIEKLKKGQPPIFEPHLEDTILNNIKRNFLKFTSNINDLNDCDFIFLAYDTPVDENDESDTTILTNSIKYLSEILKNDTIVIITSQSPVGFCSELRQLLRTHNTNLELAYSPENLRLGEAIKCYLEPERIILGTDNKETEERCIKLFNSIVNQQNILCMNLESAEMVKHGINSFLATSIVFANHLSDICSEKGAKIKDVIEGMKSDIRIGRKAYLAPGIGFSGGTLGRDLKVLSKVNNKILQAGNWKPATIFEEIHHLNSMRKYDIVNKMQKYFKGIEGKNIGVLGLTYKPGTSTLRRSLPIEIIDIAHKAGANIFAFDPKADYNELLNMENIFRITNSIEELISQVDYLVVLTEWPEFKEFNWSSVDKNISLLDTKNYLNLNNPKIKYITI
jgi:UDPglucose 6-dehydrogenase